MFTSIIIPTIGRHTITRAIHSVLAQTIPPTDYEIIVVNDSGSELPTADWQNLPNLRLLHTNKRERSFARNAGAAIAKGKYLAFLDDDDWLLPNALADLQALAQAKPEAVWLYGGIQVLDDAGHIFGESNSGLSGNCLAQVMGGAWIPLQSSIIERKAFMAVGGFDPAIIGTEDQDICRRLALVGDFGNVPAFTGCLFRGADWLTSTNYLRATADTRVSRDTVLSAPNVFARLRNSTQDAYWQGRMIKVFLSTVHYNIKMGRWLAALSRFYWGGVWFVSCGLHLLKSELWDGVRAEHPPNTLHFITTKDSTSRIDNIETNPMV
jgi:glycosyltransferase involved in cell wall biosynthesis